MSPAKRALPSPAYRLTTLALSALVGVFSSSTYAFRVDTGNPDLKLRWDNTLRVNAGWRIEDIDDAIGDNPIYDEGTYRFDQGDMITQRLDWVSELDVVWRNKFGGRVSVAAWYDNAYRDTDVEQNPALRKQGYPSSYRNDRFSDLTKNYYRGPYGEVLDAFIFADHTFGEVPVTLDLTDRVVFEQDRYPALGGGVIAPDLHVVDVVPAVAVERVVDHRRPEQEPDLVTGHTHFDLVEVLFFDDISLRNVGSIYAAG